MTLWHGVYRDGWQGLLVADQSADPAQLALFDRGGDYTAFAHPAKASRNLLQRIFDHLEAHYGLMPGARILDCFCGVGTTAIECVLRGYHFVGVELEPHFAALAQQNVRYWRHRFGPQPGTACVVQGDARALPLRAVGACVGSPPYSANGLGHYRGAAADAKEWQEKSIGNTTYGTTPGNLGNLREGDLAAVIGSPPYADRCSNDNQRTIHREGLRQGHNE